MTENKNHLGLDKFQVTVIKSNYNSSKPILKLIEKDRAKVNTANQKYQDAVQALKKKYEDSVQDLISEMQAYKTQVEILDKFSLETTEKSCGIALTSEQVVNFLSDPQAFEDFKNQKLGKDIFSDTETPSPADELPFGETKEEEVAA